MGHRCRPPPTATRPRPSSRRRPAQTARRRCSSSSCLAAVTRPRTRSPCCGSPTARDARGCCESTARAAHSCSNVSARRSTSSGCRFASRHEILCATAACASGGPRPTAACRPAPRRVAGSSTSSRRRGRSSTALLGAGRRPTRSRARNGGLTRTTTSAPCSSTATCTQWNALEAADGFKLVDPDGLLAEPEYDLGIIMREDPLDLLEATRTNAHGGSQHARASTPTAIWEWGVVERVSTGLLPRASACSPSAEQMLATSPIASRAKSTRRLSPSRRCGAPGIACRRTPWCSREARSVAAQSRRAPLCNGVGC